MRLTPVQPRRNREGQRLAADNRPIDRECTRSAPDARVEVEQFIEYCQRVGVIGRQESNALYRFYIAEFSEFHPDLFHDLTQPQFARAMATCKFKLKITRAWNNQWGNHMQIRDIPKAARSSVPSVTRPDQQEELPIAA